jgi:ubiquinone/menaquinone biosynthesis C-methylase UbiE
METPRAYSSRDLNKAISSIDGGPVSGREALEYAAELDVLLESFRGKKILDLGAGSGLGLARGLKELGIECEVHSLSPAFSEPGPAQEVTGFIQDEASRLSVAGMAEELPYAANSFDTVAVLHVLEHVRSETRVAKILEEITRILRPGGVAHIGPIPDMLPENFMDSWLISKESLDNILRHLPDVQADWRPRTEAFSRVKIPNRYSAYEAQALNVTLEKLKEVN